MSVRHADLRLVAAADVTWVALDDVTALLLDTAETADHHPDLAAADAFRSLAMALAARTPGQ